MKIIFVIVEKASTSLVTTSCQCQPSLGGIYCSSRFCQDDNQLPQWSLWTVQRYRAVFLLVCPQNDWIFGWSDIFHWIFELSDIFHWIFGWSDIFHWIFGWFMTSMKFTDWYLIKIVQILNATDRSIFQWVVPFYGAFIC